MGNRVGSSRKWILFISLFLILTTVLVAKESNYKSNSKVTNENDSQKDNTHLTKQSFRSYIGGDAWYFKMPTVNGHYGEKICIQIGDSVEKSSDGVTIDIVPFEKYCHMSIYLLGDWGYYRNVLLPIPFEDVLKTPFDEIIRKTEPYVDWSLVLPQANGGSYRLIGHILQKIRKKLSGVGFLEDVAINENGEFVKISDNTVVSDPSGLNCSGFVKWVVDGLYIGKLGVGIPITFLKEKQYKERGGKFSLSVEDAEDPFFGLDWSRNLALAIDLLEDKDAKYGDSDVNYLRELQFFDDSGFAIDNLKRALYLLAVRQPKSFFVGSINQTVENSHGLRKHYHLAIFFPRIKLNGQFEVVVLESGKELTLEQFLTRYKDRDDRVHLVEIEGDYAFSPGEFDTLSVLKR